MPKTMLLIKIGKSMTLIHYNLYIQVQTVLMRDFIVNFHVALDKWGISVEQSTYDPSARVSSYGWNIHSFCF